MIYFYSTIIILCLLFILGYLHDIESNQNEIVNYAKDICSKFKGD